MNFYEQYKHPLWQKRRLERLKEAWFSCEQCNADDKELHVHHVFYRKGAKIWEYGDDELRVLCSSCHEEEHAAKDRLNLLLCAIPYQSAADLIEGFVEDFAIEEKSVGRFVLLGAAAAYIQNIRDESLIRDLANINPDVLADFIRQQRGGQ